MNKLVVSFSQVGKEDVGIVGGKGANLGEMTKIGIPVPSGFIVTAQSYFLFLEKNNLTPKIREILKGLNVEDPAELSRVSSEIKRLIIKSPIPKEVSDLIIRHYFALKDKKIFSRDPMVAVRSSATAEDLPSASFAGQQATFLNISGEANVVTAVRECWASLFEARAIFYRTENKFDHFKVGIAVPVQKMVQSHASGIMFTVDPVTNNKNRIVVEAIWGLGEMIVQGAVTPDHYEVDKETLKIVDSKMVTQTTMMSRQGDGKTRIHKVEPARQNKRKLTDDQVVKLAILGRELEKHYFHPQDIEFAVDHEGVFIVQTRPITTLVESGKQMSETEKKTIEKQLEKKVELLEGAPASPGIASGVVKILKSAKEIGKVVSGDVLVAPQTNPDFVPAMKKACAIVTDSGGRTSHAAIVSRELGIPAVVGTGQATTKLKNGMVVTVDGTTGKVYKGATAIKAAKENNITVANHIKPKEEVKTATKVYVNLAEPEKARGVSAMNVDGVGLLRAEFMLAQIGVHPKKVIEDHKQKEFTEKLANNLKEFAAAFYPRPVIYRATDFKTNEYKNLKGGDRYEPFEPNPMLGFRGASRYIIQPDVFKMEMDAIKIVRNKMGLNNLHVMIPFVRTVMELIEVKSLMHTMGLARGPHFKLWIMVEVPSTVILLDKFIEAGIDGVSIGNNDLTMMILGTDRDNDTVAQTYDERNAAVMWAYERVITTCKKHGITASMCGQAPSTYPDLVSKLVNWGITSISVSPDAVTQMREVIYEAEKRRS